ncbi:MAG: caspase family protein [Blastocatellia bacterium]
MKLKSSSICSFALMAALMAGVAPAGGAAVKSPAQRQADQKQADARGLRVQTAGAVAALPAGSKRFALVVGVDEYQDTQINKLEGASNDAKAIVEALVKYAGFPRDQVVLLTSDQPTERRPTRGNILRRLSNLRTAVPKDGLLLLAFAGHGIERGDQAYLLPSDAQLSGDVSLLEDTAINVEEVRRRIQQTGVGQVVMLLDACRNDPSAGRGDADNRLTKKFTQAFDFEERNSDVKAFVTLYATDVGYRAYEYKEKKQGYFTWALVEALSGAAANEKGEVTLSGVISFLQEAVPKRIRLDLGSGKVQKPYAVIQGYKASDLVLAKVAAAENVSIPDPAAVERGDWEKVQASNNPAAFFDHVKKYPNGMFTEQALWEAIRSSKDPEDYKNYLKRFPNGRNARLALVLGEDALWEKIRDSKNVADYQTYLKEYPKGRYAEIAIRRVQPPPPPVKTDAAPIRPSKGVLLVLTNAPAADIVVRPKDGASRPVQGQSVGGRFRAELPPGVYDIEVSAAKYSPSKKESVRLGNDEVEPVNIALTPLVGSIQVGPVEPNATVLIDDQKPANVSVKNDEKLIELTEVAAGRHRLKVIQQGQNEWARDVEVEGGRTKYVFTEFKAALVNLTVKTEPEAEIYIDDNYGGRANEKGELRVSNLTPGQHRILAKKNEYQAVEKAQTFSAGAAEMKLALARTVFSPEFVDEFTGGVSLWDAPRTWQASPGKLKVQGPGVGLIKDARFKDFRMEFDLVFGNGKGAVWVLRAQDESTYYLFQLTGPKAESPNIFRSFICQKGQGPKLLKLFRVPENLGVPGDKFHIIVEANGPEIKHFIQVTGTPKPPPPQPFSVTTDYTFSNGRIGFGTVDGEEFIVQFVGVIPAK